MTAGWSGRRVRRLVDACLLLKGTRCHLCGLEGADSADHDPPRSVLLRLGVPDPDDVELYLYPSHRMPCNVRRRARPITDALRLELRRARLAALGMGEPAASLSPRFARRRPSFESEESSRKDCCPVSPRIDPEKNRARASAP